MKKKEKPTPEAANPNLTEEEKRLRAEQKKRANRKKRKKIIKTLIILLIILAIAGFAVWKFFQIKNAEKQASNLTTYTVSRRTIEQVLSATGTLKPVNSYTVSAMVKGDILSAHFEEGDEVEEGAVLYVIDSGDMDNTLRQRKMSVDNARDTYNDLVADRKKLSTYSKYVGTIEKLYVEVGDSVRKDQVIADVVDRDTMRVDIPFFSVDADTMRVGEAVQLTIVGTGETLTGTIVEIARVEGTSPTGARTRNVTVSATNAGGITKSTEASGLYGVDITGSGTGKFYYNVDEQITAAYDGEIKSLPVSEGSRVGVGTLVMTLDGKDLENSIKKASQSLETAQMNYDNTLDTIDDYTITAPIKGTVVEKSYNAGESIDAASGGSKTMAIIYDLSALTFEMNIDELDIRSLEKGQTVTVTSDAYEGQTFTGSVTKISKVGSTQNGTTVYPVTVTIDEENALATLLPGMNIDAEIIISRSENVLAVPTGAIQRGSTVKVVRGDAAGAETASDSSDTSADAASGRPQGFPEGFSGGDLPEGFSEGSFPAWGEDGQRPRRDRDSDGATEKSEDKTEDKTEDKSEDKSEEKTEDKTEDKSETKTEEKTESSRPQSNGTSGSWNGQRPSGDGTFGGSNRASLYGSVPADTAYETVRVQTGISDDDYIEIVSGLSEGDVVIVESTSANTTSFGFGMGGMGGGMPGGMGGGMPGGGNMGGNRGGFNR